MNYAPGAPVGEFVADPKRVLLGVIVAPVVPSLGVTIFQFSFPSFGGVVTLGLMSILTMFLPLVLWRLPRTRHPFWTCVVVGGFSAPGLFGYTMAVIMAFAVSAPITPLMVLLITFPLGAVGGAVFWLCVVWRSEAWKLDRQS